MAKYFGSGRFPLKCLKCEHEFTETIDRLEAEVDITCPACGIINRIDAKQLREIMRGADKILDEMGRKMKKFSSS